MSASPHLVTIEFSNGWPHYYSMTCEAAPDALCRARFDCYCEVVDSRGVTDGIPWHSSQDELHEGRFVPDWCHITEWFNEGEGEENLVGEVSVRVREEWDSGGFYGYTVVDEDSQP